MSDTERRRVTPVELKEVGLKVPPPRDEPMGAPIEPLDEPDPVRPTIQDYVNVGWLKLKTIITPKPPQMIERFKNWRTTVLGILLGIAAFITELGILPEETAQTIAGVIASVVAVILVFILRDPARAES